VKKLLVSLPALNEESTVGALVRSVPASIPGIDRVDILVVDDGSTDSTAAEAASAGALVASHGRNRGLGEAFRTALRFARRGGYHWLVTMDADGQFDPAGIPALLEPVLRGRAAMATCSRFMDPAGSRGIPTVKRLGNLMVAAIVSRLSGVEVRDATCGFRAYGPEALELLSSFSRFTYTQEALIDLAWKGFPIEEVALPVRPTRLHGKSRISSNLWRYATLSIGAMYSSAHDHMPWRFYGLPGLLSVIAGLAGELFVLAHWFISSKVTPFKGVAIAGLFLVVIGILLLIVASLADTSSHSRHLLEEIIAENVRRNRDRDS
jgi:glycosyltransferase involved in cell wall biosynthesis